MSRSPAFAPGFWGRALAVALAAPVLLAALVTGGLAQTPATDAPAGAPSDPMMEILLGPIPMFAVLILIFWLLIFRPQQKRMRQQQEMLKAIRRGDTVVTSGGIVGKVTKSVDGEDLEVEIAPNTRVRLVRHMVSDVRSKAEPVNDNAKPA